ncbi:MAG: BON domain-containing protein [Anaerolineae bacterium]
MTKSKHRDSDRPVEAEEPRPAEQSEPGLEAEGSRPVEERLLDIEPDDVEFEEDLTTERAFDTQRSEGHTYDPWKAEDQGLTYTPPSDPPVVPSEDDPQGAEIAAGFAPSMEAADIDVEDLPERVDDRDLDLEEDVYEALRYNSETRGLQDIRVYAHNGVVSLSGTVPSDEDLAQVYNIVGDLEGVIRVHNEIQVGGP